VTTGTESPARERLATVAGASVVYGRGEYAVRALDNADLTIETGERVALLGRSGSGKTTLLHVLGGLIEPSAGTVEWRGRPLFSLDAAARRSLRRRAIAYVFQGSNLLPYFNVFENVAFAASGADGETQAAFSPSALLELVGLKGKADHLPSELSGGEAQRVAIARALAQAPALLLCDEPTGHLDSDTGERVLDLIDDLQRELGFALVIATHDADVAARLPRAVELHDGRVVTAEPVG
jgi:ABC-type lipoprotein export system ATPase subunit